MRLSCAARTPIDKPARLMMSEIIDRPFSILTLIRSHLDGADLGWRRDSRGGRTDGRPNRHHPNVKSHIAGGRRRHAEILRERHGKRGRTMMRVAEHGDRSGRDRSNPSSGRNEYAEAAALI